MKRLTVGVIAALVLAVAAAIAVSRHGGSSHGEGTASGPGAAASGAAAPVTVGVATATTRDVPVTVDASGSVVPLETVDVRAQAATTVRSVAIKEGQFVSAGALLFTLDDRADRAALDKSRQQQAVDQAKLADAQRQLVRSKELIAQNFIAASAVDTAQANVDAAAAAVRADAAAVQSAQVAVGYDTVRAPLAGRAGAIAVYPGSLVSPTGSPLVTISRIDPIAVSFTVSESEVGSLLQGLRAGSAVSVIPGADAAPGNVGAAAGPAAAQAARTAARADRIEGRLTFVDNAIDPGTGTIKAKAEFRNAQQHLWPGQYVRVHLTLRTLPQAVVIPQEAIIQRGAERGVYVVGADGKAAWRDVHVVLATGADVAVEGVRTGERVVTDGKQNLRAGTPVHAAPGTGAAAASKPGADPSTTPGAGGTGTTS